MSVEYFTKRRKNPGGFLNRVTEYKLQGGKVWCKSKVENAWFLSQYKPSDLLNGEWFIPKLPESLENK